MFHPVETSNGKICVTLSHGAFSNCLNHTVYVKRLEQYYYILYNIARASFLSSKLFISWCFSRSNRVHVHVRYIDNECCPFGLRNLFVPRTIEQAVCVCAPTFLKPNYTIITTDCYRSMEGFGFVYLSCMQRTLPLMTNKSLVRLLGERFKKHFLQMKSAGLRQLHKMRCGQG